jgi:hypothetical protein
MATHPPVDPSLSIEEVNSNTNKEAEDKVTEKASTSATGVNRKAAKGTTSSGSKSANVDVAVAKRKKPTQASSSPQELIFTKQIQYLNEVIIAHSNDFIVFFSFTKMRLL